MGYNTVVLYLNDQFDTVRDNAEESADRIFGAMSYQRAKAPHILGTMVHPGQVTVMPSIHSSSKQVLVAGGNCIVGLTINGIADLTDLQLDYLETCCKTAQTRADEVRKAVARERKQRKEQG